MLGYPQYVAPITPIEDNSERPQRNANTIDSYSFDECQWTHRQNTDCILWQRFWGNPNIGVQPEDITGGEVY